MSVMHDESFHTRILNFIPESSHRFPNFYIVNFNIIWILSVLCKAIAIKNYATCSRLCAWLFIFFIRWHFLFYFFCNLHNDRFDDNSDNSRESKPISKVAKLDFQVIAFGHLFSIARLMLRNVAIGYLADLFNMC